METENALQDLHQVFRLKVDRQNRAERYNETVIMKHIKFEFCSKSPYMCRMAYTMVESICYEPLSLSQIRSLESLNILRFKSNGFKRLLDCEFVIYGPIL